MSGERFVVTTKLHIPAPRPHRATRRSLVAKVREATHTRLVLVSAPAGAGKTTLLASWHADAEESRRFAWLSLDERDNDPVCFWGGVLEALRVVEPRFGGEIDAALRAPAADPIELAMPLLVNALARLTDPTVLVLDDYHEIASPDIHQALSFVIARLPDSLQIAIATRRDPPLGLARLRARGSLLEVRAADLRLGPEEASELLNASMGLDLSTPQVCSLRQRTEGWAAGLQLAGLSLQGHVDRQPVIDSFAGDDRQIIDYLMAEVLEGQDPSTRQFLLCTSILDRLGGPLCDAVLDTAGSARRLLELERANLFLVPLDRRKRCYRYHGLFRELLQHELHLTEPSQPIAELHRRAWRWHLDHGFVPEAIRHATAAGDVDEAVELIAAHWLTYVNRGQLQTVAGWIAELPGDRAEGDPRLCLAQAWMLLLMGRPAEAEAAIRAAEARSTRGPMRSGSQSIAANAATVRSAARLMLGDVGAAAENAALAAEKEPDSAGPWRPLVSNVLGMAAYWSGEVNAAIAAFEESISVGDLAANRIHALGYLATISAEHRDHDEAQRLFAEGLRLADEHDLSEHWVTIMSRYAAGESLRARGDLTAARTTVEHGLIIARRCSLRLDTVHGLLSLTATAAAGGDRPEARRLLARAERQLAVSPDPGILSERVKHARRDVGSPGGARPRGLGHALSDREREVLGLLATDLSVREIGDELFLSFNTVKTHVRHIYAKLRVGSRREAVARARERHLL